MKKRSPLGVFGLSIVTFGIYDIYWLYVVKKELNAKTTQHTPTLWLLISGPVLLIISYIILFSSGKIGSSVVANGSYTTTGSNISTQFFVGFGLVGFAWLFTLIASVIWIFKFSKAVNEYTRGKMSTAITFIILYVIHFIALALIQDTFNDMLDHPGAMAAPGFDAPQGPPPAYNPQPTATAPTQPSAPVPPAQPPADTSQPTVSTVQPAQPNIDGVQPVSTPQPPVDPNIPQPPTPAA